LRQKGPASPQSPWRKVAASHFPAPLASRQDPAVHTSRAQEARGAGPPRVLRDRSRYIIAGLLVLLACPSGRLCALSPAPCTLSILPRVPNRRNSSRCLLLLLLLRHLLRRIQLGADSKGCKSSAPGLRIWPLGAVLRTFPFCVWPGRAWGLGKMAGSETARGAGMKEGWRKVDDMLIKRQLGTAERLLPILQPSYKTAPEHPHAVRPP